MWVAALGPGWTPTALTDRNVHAKSDPDVLTTGMGARHAILPRLDHVIVGIDDLDRGMDALERMTGVRPVPGGSHPGFGTHNALLSLGDGTYLELIAPDPAATALDPRATVLRSLRNPAPVGWMAASDDLAVDQERLRAAGFEPSEIVESARDLPDGSRLSWRLLFVNSPANPLLPAFIHWTSPDAHPSGAAPGGCALTSFHLETPDPVALRAGLERAGVEVAVRDGVRPRLALSLSCPKGDIDL